MCLDHCLSFPLTVTKGILTWRSGIGTWRGVWGQVGQERERGVDADVVCREPGMLLAQLSALAVQKIKAKKERFGPSEQFLICVLTSASNIEKTMFGN